MFIFCSYYIHKYLLVKVPAERLMEKSLLYRRKFMKGKSKEVEERQISVFEKKDYVVEQLVRFIREGTHPEDADLRSVM